MRIAALDPGKTTGWAKVATNGVDVTLLGYGEIPVLGSGFDGLLSSVWTWMDVNVYDAQLVVFEGPLMAYSVRTAIELHEVRAAIRGWCLYHRMPYAAYHPSTVKAAVTGIAGATKAQVAAAASRQFGVERFPTDHASDAVAIAMTHLIKAEGMELGDRYGRLSDKGKSDAVRRGVRKHRDSGVRGAGDAATKAAQDGGRTKGRRGSAAAGDGAKKLPGRRASRR